MVKSIRQKKSEEKTELESTNLELDKFDVELTSCLMCTIGKGIDITSGNQSQDTSMV